MTEYYTDDGETVLATYEDLVIDASTGVTHGTDDTVVAWSSITASGTYYSGFSLVDGDCTVSFRIYDEDTLALCVDDTDSGERLGE